MNQISASVEKGGTTLERKAVNGLGQAATKAAKVGRQIQPDVVGKAVSKAATKVADNLGDGIRRWGRIITRTLN